MPPRMIHILDGGIVLDIGGETMSSYPATHPIWGLIRLTVIMVTLVVVLFLTASQFDKTELQTILICFLTTAVGETVINKVMRQSNNETKENNE